MIHPPIIANASEFVRIARILHERGWSEANSGNMSVRLEESWNGSCSFFAEISPPVTDLNGISLLITSSGIRMRDVMSSPSEGLTWVKVADGGRSLMLIRGGNPTSEWPTHVLVHDVLVRLRPDWKAVIHAHPPHIIAITHILERGIALNAISRAHPEVRILIPEGVGFVTYRMPGTTELGTETARILEHHRIAIWERHGVISTGESLGRALDWIEILEKAAEIVLLSLHVGKMRGLTEEEIQACVTTYGERFRIPGLR